MLLYFIIRFCEGHQECFCPVKLYLNCLLSFQRLCCHQDSNILDKQNDACHFSAFLQRQDEDLFLSAYVNSMLSTVSIIIATSLTFHWRCSGKGYRLDFNYKNNNWNTLRKPFKKGNSKSHLRKCFFWSLTFKRIQTTWWSSYNSGIRRQNQENITPQSDWFLWCQL